MAQIAGNIHTHVQRHMSHLPPPPPLLPPPPPLLLSFSPPLSAHPRNRAIHGDIVAVRILSRSEWKSRSATLPHTPADSENTQSSASNEQGHSQLETMPTGVVVGVLHRASREYVASFPVSEFEFCKKEEIPIIIS